MAAAAAVASIETTFLRPCCAGFRECRLELAEPTDECLLGILDTSLGELRFASVADHLLNGSGSASGLGVLPMGEGCLGSTSVGVSDSAAAPCWAILTVEERAVTADIYSVGRDGATCLFHGVVFWSDRLGSEPTGRGLEDFPGQAAIHWETAPTLAR